MIAIKFFIILGMILGAIFIIPIIVGAISLNRLNKATNREEIKGVAICTLLFCSLIAGILMLCLTENDFEQKNGLSIEEQRMVDSFKEAMDEIYEEDSPVENIPLKIREIKKLYDDGLITDKEYNQKRKKYIDLL